ncbi:MAG: mucoidy inhibitor MuiA family protein [Deltaproteobacteria bacterium]|nr:mucoidy inhibitor MuiA family protein [Deltaproteobacteria bacterium]
MRHPSVVAKETTMAHRSWLVYLGVATMVASCTHPTGIAVAPKPTPPAPVVVPPPAAQDVADAESDAKALRSRVSRVTVYSDRARVTRQATAEVTTEPVVYAFRNLPGWVDDGSVQVAASGGQIVDVRVDRRFLARATDASWRKIEAEQKALTRKLAGLRDELAVLDAQKQQIESIKAFSLAKITQDTTIGNISVKSYGDVVDFISASLRATAKSRREVQDQIDELTPDYDASQRRVADAQNLMKLEETTVLVTLQAPSAAQATVELTYMLPGVTWEPMHELRATTTDAKTVEVVSYAALTQTSGEDWGGAELSFSTQSTTQSVRIPELEALTLGDTQTATRILTSQVSSFTRAQTAFQGQSQLWNSVHNGSSDERARESFEHTYQSNLEFLQVVQGRTVSLFESLEKRGTTAHYKAQPAPSVRGDGHPVRLLIGRSTLGSTQQTVAAPEQSLNAARTLAMTNATGQPLLPGKVALYQDGTFLGLTDMDFISNGEKFSLFLSVADHLKLSRQLDRKQSTLVRKTRNQMQVMFIVTVENLSADPTTFTLADRVPVSENKEIKVDKISITPAVKPDSQGLLHWELTLKPGEKREFRIGYQVEYPAELVIETSRRRASEPAPANNMPAAPSKTRIEDQIMELESNF